MESPLRSETVPAGRSGNAGVSPPPGARGLNPQRTTRLFLLATVLGICDQNYWQYSNVDHYLVGYWLPFIHGTGAAPEQYRIGVKMTAWWLAQHLSWSFRYGYTLMDIVGSVAGVLLIYDLLQRRLVTREATVTLQWFASSAFVALFCFYMLWEGFFFRPETLPSLGLTACMAWLWTRSSERRNAAALTICGLLAAATAQAWIRADIPCALNAGVFLAALTGTGRGLSLSKRAAVITSLACIGLAAGSQLYIMRVLYPHAGYGNTPLIMLTHDFHQPLTLPPFLIFILPIAWTGVEAWRQRATLDTGSKALLLGAAIYFVLWIVLGKMDEVRIFIPFAVTLIPLTIELALRRITGETPEFNGAGCEAGV